VRRWLTTQSIQAAKPTPVETQHEDTIVCKPSPSCSVLIKQQHDAQLDYYGKRLATCSSDKTIRIFNVVKGEAKGEPVILKGFVASILRPYEEETDADRHTAPVWQLSWAHPSFGSILASSSYDGRVFIWKEVGPGQSSGGGGELQDGWERIKEHTLHTASGGWICLGLNDADMVLVNSIAWAPYDLGPILACASSDGKISVLSFQSESSPKAVIRRLVLIVRRWLDGRINIPRTRYRSQRDLVGSIISLHHQQCWSPFLKPKSGHYAKAFRHWWIRQLDQDLGI
jgi:protein transport protein SEC13